MLRLPARSISANIARSFNDAGGAGIPGEAEPSIAAAVADRPAAFAEVSGREWDVVVIGGGATGLGCAVDAASRGLSTLLLEARDYGSETSSRSTKLIHGGVRYLRSFQFGLVREALRERERLYENAPDLVREIKLVVPVSNVFDRIYREAGLRLYDVLSGKTGFGGTTRLGRARLKSELPGLRPGVAGQGLQFSDGQFDDARLLIALLHTLEDLGGVAFNYAAVERLEKAAGRIVGAVAKDMEEGEEHRIRARSVINATGVFSDRIRQLDTDTASPDLVFSRGTHLVLPREFWPGESGLVVPGTPDKRVLFILPWLERVLVGTTDVPVEEPIRDPVPTSQEISYLLDLAGRYMTRPPRAGDLLSVFAGLRPLPRRGGSGVRTASLSRSHIVEMSESGLVTITGGKWTTYRRMAEHAVDRIAEVLGGNIAASRTHDLRLDVRSAAGLSPETGRLHPALTYTLEDVRRAANREQARTVEDVLCRRTRAAFLDAAAAIDMIDAVAKILAQELGRGPEWIEAQSREASESIRRFVPSAYV